MMYLSMAVLVVLWLIGFTSHVGGGLIHLLLIAAAGLFFFDVLTPRYSAHRTKYE